jgi:hypothetical protein
LSAESVRVEVLILVLSSIAVTDAAGTTVPFASTTVPTMVAVSTYALTTETQAALPSTKVIASAAHFFTKQPNTGLIRRREQPLYRASLANEGKISILAPDVQRVYTGLRH